MPKSEENHGFLHQLKEKAGGMIDAVKRGAHQLAEAVQNESDMHIFLSTFKRQIEDDLKKYKKEMPEDSVEAAKTIIEQLNDLLEKDSKNKRNKYPDAQFKLLIDACTVIDKNIVRMTAAPGYFNRFIAGFNELIQKFFGVKDFIPLVEKTAIAQSSPDTKFSVPNFKDELYTMRNQSFKVVFQEAIEEAEQAKEEIEGLAVNPLK